MFTDPGLLTEDPGLLTERHEPGSPTVLGFNPLAVRPGGGSGRVAEPVQ
ncbi:MAG TPA: hypothetical protein VMV17_03355 [Streptosporangiaceae bacterium]|nr:hypothetical protein [Streptosporangiaceae bacterium]